MCRYDHGPETSLLTQCEGKTTRTARRRDKVEEEVDEKGMLGYLFFSFVAMLSLYDLQIGFNRQHERKAKRREALKHREEDEEVKKEMQRRQGMFWPFLV